MSYGFLFTNLMAIIGVAYGWINPFVGLMVYYFFAILRPHFMWGYGWNNPNDAPRYSLYIALATLLGFFASGMGAGGSIRGARLALFGLVVYAVAGIIGWQCFAVAPDWAWQSLQLQLKIVLMVFVTMYLVQNPKHIKIFAWVIFLCLAYLAYSFNESYFSGWNRVLTQGYAFIDRNGVAMIMVLGVPFGFFLGIQTKSRIGKLVCLFGVACMVHVILFSFSRGGQLGLCIVGASIFFFALTMLPRKGLTLTIGLLFVLLTLRLAGPEVRERFFSIFVDKKELDASAASRYETWRAAWLYMLEHPGGAGPRNFMFHVHDYGLPYGKAVHNLWLQAGADYGFAGMFGLIVFYGVSAWQCFKMSLTKTARKLGWPVFYGAMVYIGVTGFIVCCMFIGPEGVEVGYVICTLGLCTVAYVNRVAAAGIIGVEDNLPELAQVPKPGQQEEPGFGQPDHLPAPGWSPVPG